MTQKRSETRGTRIEVDAGSSEAIVALQFELEGSGEPKKTVRYDVDPPGVDGRTFRIHGPKFGVNGLWPLLVTAIDAVGRKSTTRCLPGVTVTF